MPTYYRKLSKGIRWYYKFSYNSNTYFSPCIYLSKAEAKKAEADKYRELDEKRRFPNLKNDLKLDTLIEHRLNYIKVKNSRKYYKANYKYLCDLIGNLGNLWVSEISKSDINSLLISTAEYNQSRGESNYTANAMLRVYKALFNYGIENFDLSDRNPCRGIKLMPINKRLKYIPSDSNIELVKLTCDNEQTLLIDFVAETGCRINEALNLKGSDIYPDFVVLYTRKSKNSNLTPRKVPIPPCIKNLKFSGRVFARWSETPRFLEKRTRDLKMKRWTWHNLRHRYASKLSKDGKPLFEIMILLGHNNLSTTQNYLQMLS